MTPDLDPEVREWFDRVERELPPKIAASAVVMQIAPDNPDAKSAVELGYALLLDKPLIIVRWPDRQVPSRLARAADAIVDWSDDQATMHARMSAAMDQVLADLGGQP